MLVISCDWFFVDNEVVDRVTLAVEPLKVFTINTVYNTWRRHLATQQYSGGDFRVKVQILVLHIIGKRHCSWISRSSRVSFISRPNASRPNLQNDP